jgi:hypothetical protein
MSYTVRLFGRDLSRSQARDLFICAAASVIATGLFAWWLSDRRAVAAAASWPVVEGRVDERKVTTQHRRKSAGGNRTTVTFAYSFQIAGKPYTGERLYPVSDASWLPFMTQDIPDGYRYEKGRSCVVHYDPADPSNCCLVPESNLASGVRLVLALVAAAVAALFAWPFLGPAPKAPLPPGPSPT